MPAPEPKSAEETIAEFQRRKREFQPRWNRNFLAFALPGFVLFAVSGSLEEPLSLAGIGLFLIACIRGAYYVFRYRRCPVCADVQVPRWQFPYRRCDGCGARLSWGWKDST